MPEKNFIVYMLASGPRGTLYIGVTSDLPRRVFEHRSDTIEGFTKRYGVHRLVWYEPHFSAEAAIRREKRLKRYKRDWKIQLIEESNPDWADLFSTLGPS